MNEREKLIEAMNEAIRKARFQYGDQAKGALSAITSAGYAVVPVEMTDIQYSTVKYQRGLGTFTDDYFRAIAAGRIDKDPTP